MLNSYANEQYRGACTFKQCIENSLGNIIWIYRIITVFRHTAATQYLNSLYMSLINNLISSIKEYIAILKF